MNLILVTSSNALNVNSIAQLFSYIFALPFVGIGLMLLGGGIVFGRTHDVVMAFFGAFLLGAILDVPSVVFKLSFYIVPSGELIFMGVILGIMIFVSAYSHKKKGS